MKAFTSRTYGAPADVLRPEDVAPPEPGPGDVVVRVRATSVNPADWHLVRGEPRVARLQVGLRRPAHAVLGCDVAGTVEAVGAGVTAFAPGDAVYGSPFMAGFGAFAELVRVPADRLAPAPAGVPVEEAAAVPLAGCTALQAVRDGAGVTAGRRVLVVGASGGVGTFAVQLAAGLGAHVTGVCSARNAELVRSLGADEVIAYDVDGFPGPAAAAEPYDAVLQVAGDASPAALCRLLVPDGVLVQVSGDARGRWLGAVGRVVRGKVRDRLVSQRVVACSVAPTAADLVHLAGLLEAGALRAVVERTHPFAELPAALAHLETGRARGKVVVAPVP